MRKQDNTGVGIFLFFLALLESDISDEALQVVLRQGKMCEDRKFSTIADSMFHLIWPAYPDLGYCKRKEIALVQFRNWLQRLNEGTAETDGRVCDAMLSIAEATLQPE